MASSSAEFLPFGQALQRCGLFQVPDYQRTFAWESKQLNDLVSDLARAADSTNELHHPMGTLFLQKSQNPVRNHLDETLDVMEVVDGQQRLTSLIMLLAALCQALKRPGVVSAFEGMTPKKLQAYADSIEKKILWDDADEKKRVKITIQTASNQFFESLILCTVDEEKHGPRLPPQSKAEHRLMQAMQFFSSWLLTQDLLRIKNIIEERLDFILFSASATFDVSMLFEVVNNRGLPIGQMDKIKNWLLRLARIDLNADPTLPNLVDAAWGTVIPNLEKGLHHEDDMLKYFWLTAYQPEDNPQWKKNDSSSFVQRYFERPENKTRDSFTTYLNRLVKASEIIAEFPVDVEQQPESRIALSCADPTLRRTLQRIWLNIYRLSELTLVFAVVIAVRLRFDSLADPDFWESMFAALDTFFNYSFRMHVIRDSKPSTGAISIYRLCNRLATAKDTIPQFLVNIRDRSRFYLNGSDTFDLPVASWYESKYAKLLLWLFEESKNDDLGLLDFGALTIEHIFPVSARLTDWPHWTQKTIDQYLDDFGNLSLCSQARNSAYSNLSFVQKKGPGGVCYGNSPLATERMLALHHEWTPTSVQQRHAEIVAFLNHRFGWNRIA